MPTLNSMYVSPSTSNQLNVPCWLYVVIVLFIFMRYISAAQDMQTYISQRKKRKTTSLILFFLFLPLHYFAANQVHEPEPW
ncbi:hypothetical protein [Vibrio splendidus]|uniref:hypothetical protein n=1 Tax=Vibrio splendidus TaxID=29497 RepID=UPI0021C390B5|nr:hypothetical protein [Vibrio splendidus]